MAKKIIIEDVNLGNSGEVSKDKINNNFKQIDNGLDTLDGETVKKASVTTKLGFSQTNVPSEYAVSIEASRLQKEIDSKPTATDVAVGLLYLGFDVPTISQLTKPTITSPNGDVIRLKSGHAVRVLDQIDEDGNPYYYQYDGTQWNKTKFTDLPSDIVYKDYLQSIMNNPVFKNVVIDVSPSSGAIKNNTGFNIPSGSTGKNSAIYFHKEDDSFDKTNYVGQKIAFTCVIVVSNYSLLSTDPPFFYQFIQRHRNGEFVENITLSKSPANDIIIGNVLKRTINLSYTITQEDIDREDYFNFGLILINDNNVSSLVAVSTESYFIAEDNSIPHNIDTLNNSISDIEKNINKYGSVRIGNSNFQNFGGIGVNFQPIQQTGYLDKLFIKTNNGGKLRLGLGFLDQRNWAIIRDTFEVDLSQGENTIDLLERKIIGVKDEMLFTYLDRLEGSPSYGVNYTEGNIEMYYNDVSTTEPLNKLGIHFGGYLSYNYTVRAIVDKSMLTPIYETDLLRTEVSNQGANIASIQSSLGVVSDATGNKYRLRVINGEVKAIPMNYRKALVIGNSFTIISTPDNISWWGTWGMSASKKEKDFVHRIQAGLQAKEPTASVIPFTAAVWERDFSTDKDAFFAPILTPDLDCIIIRLGENIPNDETAENIHNATVSLIDYCISKCPNADIYITGVFYPSVSKDAGFQSATSARGLSFIPLSHLNIADNRSYVGAIVKGDDGLDHTITNGGVAWHPSDVGMLSIANEILVAIGYNVI